MNIGNIKDILVDYINKNKNEYNIDYNDTIITLKQLITEIEDDYKNLGDE